MDDSHGTTAIWPGSHRWKEFDPSRIPLVPQVPVGSCLLWDFRLFHSGTANKSEIGRPMICSTFARRWYEDPVNFIKGTLPRLIIEPEFLSSLSPETRRLFVGRR
jgi:ectoine hydroxylase-related dioxygenase (phytanoyl-CoA dioxygenase family)